MKKSLLLLLMFSIFSNNSVKAQDWPNLNKYKKDNAFLDFLNDAEESTPNYMYRHQNYGLSLGSWRWKGVFTFREKIIPVLFNNELRGIDFGGAYGPIAKHTDIVDFNQYLSQLVEGKLPTLPILLDEKAPVEMYMNKL